MKISSTLIKSIALGISVSALAQACQKTDINSGETKIDKPKHEKPKDSCPACGRG